MILVLFHSMHIIMLIITVIKDQRSIKIMLRWEVEQ